MRNTKKIWRDNTMPPTNYIWIRTDLDDNLIGVYEWLNEHWHKLDFDGYGTYNRCEIDYLLQYTELEVVRKIRNGEYNIGTAIVDAGLSHISTKPVQNRVVTNALDTKLNKSEFESFKRSIGDFTGVRYGTTEEWNNSVGFVPKAGEIIIYSDYKTKDSEGRTIYYPGIKIGSGNAYVQDLAFLNEDLSDLLWDHIRNTEVHINNEERARWNNKLNVNDVKEVVNETLIFNRD